ncbi:MAG: SDR family NAD(P)-dependent oxidoreductase [Pseudomonadota bacterium]|jgi:NAD(P)-dependent dehydrogenase (short-subunit alcohol dehydrogenase family)
MSFLNIAKKRILVAGGSGGIGQEIVRILTVNGAHVIIADRNVTDAARLCAELSTGEYTPSTYE